MPPEKRYEILTGDCLEVMKTLPDNSVDAVVSDPPYGLSFMGKSWDHGVPGEDFWKEAMRVAKPGAYILAFGGTRTYHRLAVAIEDAGWEIRDCLSWLYGSGFPKSLNVSKAIDKAAGALGHESVAFTVAGRTDKNLPNPMVRGYVPPRPSTDAAKQWAGWGTALKPSFEPIIMARKPMGQTVASNVLEHGTGALNIGGCRIGTEGGCAGAGAGAGARVFGDGLNGTFAKPVAGLGRWPANTIFSHSEECSDTCVEGCPVKMLDEQSGETKSSNQTRRNSARPKSVAKGAQKDHEGGGFSDGGGASRFFYVSKPSRAERDAGLEGFAKVAPKEKGNGLARLCEHCGVTQLKAADCKCETKSWVLPGTTNHHPTVKPVQLMRYLCRLVTPPGGTILDPFMGSGSTGCGAVLEGFKFIGIDKEPEYAEIARGRIEYWASKGKTDQPVKKLLPKKPAKKKEDKKDVDPNLTLEL